MPEESPPAGQGPRARARVRGKVSEGHRDAAHDEDDEGRGHGEGSVQLLNDCFDLELESAMASWHIMSLACHHVSHHATLPCVTRTSRLATSCPWFQAFVFQMQRTYVCRYCAGNMQMYGRDDMDDLMDDYKDEGDDEGGMGGMVGAVHVIEFSLLIACKRYVFLNGFLSGFLNGFLNPFPEPVS